MKYDTLDAVFEDPKYSDMKRTVYNARSYIDQRMDSDYDMMNALTFIKNYYFNDQIKVYKKEYTKEVFKFLIKELDYDGFAAKMLAKATPIPMDHKMGKVVLSFFYGVFIGRINERHFDTFCFMSGIDKHLALECALLGEHGSNILAGAQNAALYGAVSLIKKTAFGSDLNPSESFFVGAIYTAVRSAYTYRDQKQFKKDGNYRPYYWSWTTPSGALFWTLSAYHNLKIRNKQTRFISKHFDDDTFWGKNFGEMKQLHKYMKRNTHRRR